MLPGYTSIEILRWVVAADIMNHTVQVHEESYLPVSPSKQTRAQLDAQAAGAVPLGGSAAGSPGSAAGQQATQPSPASVA